MPRLETLRAKVGATILDVMRPGWAKEINVAKLDLVRCDACILGQLFGDFDRGAETLFAMRKSTSTGIVYRDLGLRYAARDAGFFLPGVHEDERATAYATLTAAWRREIAKRVGR